MIHRPVHHEKPISAFCRLGKVARNLYGVSPEINLKIYVITADLILVDNSRSSLFPNTDSASMNEIVTDDVALVVKGRPHADGRNTRSHRWTTEKRRIQDSHVLHVVARKHGELQSGPARIGGTAPHVSVNVQSTENPVRRVDDSAAPGLVHINTNCCQPTAVDGKVCDLEPIHVLHVDHRAAYWTSPSDSRYVRSVVPIVPCPGDAFNRESAKILHEPSGC